MSDVAVYTSVWLALACFLVWQGSGRRSVGALGLTLLLAHFLAAFAFAHQWSHAAAERATARQTADLFGVGWGGGVYVNYVFAAAWLAELGWTRRGRRLHRATAFALRAFYLLIIVNAAIVFASPSRRILGVLLVAALLWAWRTRSSSAATPHADFSPGALGRIALRHSTHPQDDGSRGSGR